jgi:LysM repeat protein
LVSNTTHRRPRKLRRTGRHTTPSSVEKVAEKATKAAPAVAIAGVLVAAPAANAATGAPLKASTVAVRVHGAPQLRVQQGTTTTHVSTTAAHVSTSAKKAETKKAETKKAETETQSATRTYTVEPGDSLASIAQRFYGSDNDWTYLFQANEAKVANPNQIYPGELLLVPYGPANSAAPSSGHTAKHAKKSDPPSTTLTSSAIPSGTLSCSGLEELWEDAGGSAGEAVMAASIAMAESDGNQYALSPTDDYGYWQINASHGALATYNPLGNAKAAVEISSNGEDWTPWTTYTSGAYYGRC